MLTNNTMNVKITQTNRLMIKNIDKTY